MKIIIISALVVNTLLALDFNYDKDGESFDTVMSKNRSSKDIKGSNYVEIKNSKDMEKYKGKDLGIVVDKDTRGPVYNVVKVKNVKSSENRFNKNDRKYGMERFKKEEEKQRLIGVKIKEGFRGKVSNRVSIENAELD